MFEADRARPAGAADPFAPAVSPAFGVYVDPGRQGLLRRYLATWRHFTALVVGGLAAYLRGLPPHERRGLGILLLRFVIGIAQLPVNRKLRRSSFPVQLRRRFEMLGPTYIKLGQSLSLREDLLPREVTDELKNLLDRLPALPFEAFRTLVAAELRRPVDEVFAEIRPTPLASASIGQCHLARLHGGDLVAVKVVKPGVRACIRRDAVILRGLGAVLQLFLARYQPRRVIRDFCMHLMLETDLRLEADHAETFAAAFRNQPDIVFPRIYREHSGKGVLCMEYLDGIKPTDPRTKLLSEDDRERVVDMGAEAIVCMLYRDGFFHADLHPGNLLILPGPRCGFVDLATVGRFDHDLKRTLLYYYYSLVSNDAESAADYLAAIAETSAASDPVGFRRDVEDVCRQWSQRMRNGRFSLARLIMESIARAGRHRMYFPLDLVLMVRAIVTFEAVGQMLVPGFDVAKVSRRHVHTIILQRFGPLHIARESLTALPELVDALAKTPRLLTEALQLVEQTTRKPAENPFAGLRGTLFGGACIIAGAVLAGFDGPWPVWAALFTAGILLAIRPGR